MKVITIVDHIIEAYQNGYSISEIAKKIDRSRRCISKLLKSEGIKLRNKSETMKLYYQRKRNNDSSN